MSGAIRRLDFRVAAVCLAAFILACSGGDSAKSESGGSADVPADTTRAAATPVRTTLIEQGALAVSVTAPGRTEAAREDRVRAPFASLLVSLSISDGDRVAAGQVVAEVVSKTSEAALQGAEAMMRAARTAQDSADAERAVAIAQQDCIVTPLRVPAAGIVLSHQAQPGEYLDEGETIATVAAAGSVYFRADVAQSDLGQILPGEKATIDLPASRPDSLSAVVTGVLPTAATQSLSTPVRLDFSPARPVLVGLFGRATIVVAVHENVLTVPAQAVLRDDISGKAQVAVIDPASKARWIDVETGVREGDRIEVSGPGIRAGDSVVVQGLVGLPEGAPVRAVR